MVFSSILFLLYFLPAFLLCYFLSPAKWKNTVALLASALFYLWGAPRFFFVLLFSLLLDFYLVRLTHHARGALRQGLLVLTIAIDLGLLLGAKYLGFFTENLSLLLQSLGGEGITALSFVLPIGISFITFQRLSYVIDCYWGRVAPQEKLGDYCLYILLFPQLIAGPIVRYREIAAQLEDRRSQDSIDHRWRGLLRFVTGLVKKVLIANVLGALVDQIFAGPPDALNATTAWVGIIAYSFQIYFDFSGYSDMAIGLAGMLGFRFPENFNFPYLSRSITEFWRRWHLTLSSWMRDYLYIPLGGNRVSTVRLYVNLWVVFLLSGLWHGAAWTFIVWGIFHGAFLVLDRLFLLRLLEGMGKIPATLLTYLIVLVGWTFFRAPSIEAALAYLRVMAMGEWSGMQLYAPQQFWLVLALATLAAFAGIWERTQAWGLAWYRGVEHPFWLGVKAVISTLLVWWCLGAIYSSDFNPFIYFKF
ncbi:MAG: MBOAT family O-acyltransferase [Bacteroidota bacterium]